MDKCLPIAPLKIDQLKTNITFGQLQKMSHSDLSDWGSVTEANSNFPKHNLGAGNRGSFLTNVMDLGSVADTVRFDGGNYNFGTIA